jgi:ethanolamine utilization protein EutN
MYLGRVVGSVWSTAKDSRLDGQRLLLIQPVTPELAPTGRAFVAVDATSSAGAGELVYYCRGKESSFPFLPAEVPTDVSVVGIVDEMHVNRTLRSDEETNPC